MSKGLKVTLILANLVFLFFFVLVFLSSYFLSNFPFDLKLIRHFLTNHFIFQQFVFWVATAGLIILVITLIVLIFYPKNRTQLEILNKQGELVVERKAIEGFVLSSLNNEDFIGNPKVKAKIFKNKIKIKVIGEVKRTAKLNQQEELWRNQVITEVKNLLGVDLPIQIHVTLDKVEKSENKQSHQARVV